MVGLRHMQVQYQSQRCPSASIALCDVVVLNGVVMVNYFNELRREGRNVELAVIQMLADCVQTNSVLARDLRKLAGMRRKCSEPARAFATTKSA